MAKAYYLPSAESNTRQTKYSEGKRWKKGTLLEKNKNKIVRVHIYIYIHTYIGLHYN
jgi:hypothetical protein